MLSSLQSRRQFDIILIWSITGRTDSYSLPPGVINSFCTSISNTAVLRGTRPSPPRPSCGSLTWGSKGSVRRSKGLGSDDPVGPKYGDSCATSCAVHECRSSHRWCISLSVEHSCADGSETGRHDESMLLLCVGGDRSLLTRTTVSKRVNVSTSWRGQ